MNMIKTRWFRIVFFILAFVIILAGVVANISAPVAKWAVEDWLHKQGLEGGIGSIELDFNDGIIQLNNVTVVSQSNGQLQLGELVLKINIADLFDNTVNIQKFSVNDLDIGSILDNTSPIAIAGFVITQNEQPTTTETQTASTPWTIRLGQTEFNNIKSCTLDKATQNKATQSDTDIAVLFSNSCISLESLEWQGMVDFSTENKLQVNGKLDIRNIQAKSSDDKRLLAGIGQASIHDLIIDKPTSIAASTIALGQVMFLQHPDQSGYYFEFNKLNISKPRFNSDKTMMLSSDVIELLNAKLIHQPQSEDYLVNIAEFSILQTQFITGQTQHLKIAEVNILGIDSTLTIQADKSIAGLPVKQQTETSPDTEQTTSFIFSIDKINIDGNSRLHFVDKSVEPAIDIMLSEINIKLEKIISDNKENATLLDASMLIGEHGSFTNEGSITLFADRPTLNIKQKLNGFDMALVDTYSKKFIGHHIHHGNLEINHDLVIKQGQLDFESSLVIRKFKIESLNSEEAEQYQSELGIPLSAALNLLRDSDDNIRLKLPLSSDITNPDFSLNDIYSKVMGKAIKEAIINYYTPYGLVKLGTAMFDLATALRFDPVVFEAGISELDSEGEKALATLAQALKQRPKVDLVLCSSPTIKDKLALFGPPSEKKTDDSESPVTINDQQNAQLTELMNLRKKHVKNYLVKQLQIDANRLVICKQADEEDWQQLPDMEPHVTLSL